MKNIKSLALVLLLLIGISLQAQVPKPMKPARLVNDFANTFTSAERQRLEQKLVQFDSETSTQIALVTMSDLQGYEVQEMATRIMKEWGVGGKDDNGFLILFKPKTAASAGQVFITTGYGVEQYVTDALAKQIVQYDMIPHFKKGDVFKGMDVATSSLMSLTKGEFTGTQYLANRKKNAGRRSGGFPWLFVLIFFVFPAIFGRRRRNMSSMSGRGSSLPFWLLLGTMGSGRSHGGSFGNFNSGGGSFGGFGGGFGGGGGAGGSW